MISALLLAAWTGVVPEEMLCQAGYPSEDHLLEGSLSVGGARHKDTGDFGEFSGKALVAEGRFYHAPHCPLVIREAVFRRPDGSGGVAFFDEVRFLSADAFGSFLNTGFSGPGTCEGDVSEISFIRGRVLSDDDMSAEGQNRERMTLGSGTITVRSDDDCLSPETFVLGGGGVSGVDGSAMVFSSLAADYRSPPALWVPSVLSVSDPAVYTPSGDMVMSADEAGFRWPGEDLGMPGSASVTGGNVILSEILPPDFLKDVGIASPNMPKSFEMGMDVSPHADGSKRLSFDLSFEGLAVLSGEIRARAAGMTAQSLMGGSLISAQAAFSDLGLLSVYENYAGETMGRTIASVTLPGPAMFRKSLDGLGGWIDGLKGRAIEVTVSPEGEMKFLAMAAMFAMRGEAMIDTLGVTTKTP